MYALSKKPYLFFSPLQPTGKRRSVADSDCLFSALLDHAHLALAHFLCPEASLTLRCMQVSMLFSAAVPSPIRYL